MTTTACRVLLQLLVDAGIVAFPANRTPTVWAAVTGPITTDLTPAVGFISFGAERQGQSQYTGEQNDFYRVQLLVRGMNYKSAGEYCQKIYDWLRKVGIPPERNGFGWKRVTVGAESFIITGVKPITAPMFLAKHAEDSTQLWVMNESFRLKAV